MGKRDQYDPADMRVESRVQEVVEPAGVGLWEEPLWSGREQDAREVDHDVDTIDCRMKCLRGSEICLDHFNVRSPAEGIRQRPTVLHQAELASTCQEMLREEAAEVTCSPSDQGRWQRPVLERFFVVSSRRIVGPTVR
jgi:hypothetical protein